MFTCKDEGCEIQIAPLGHSGVYGKMTLFEKLTHVLQVHNGCHGHDVPHQLDDYSQPVSSDVCHRRHYEPDNYSTDIHSCKVWNGEAGVVAFGGGNIC